MAHDQAPPGRGWPRAATLLGVTLAVSVVQPSLLIAFPFLALAVVLGAGRPSILFAAALALLVALGGPREGLWYMERGWAVLVAGWFAALSSHRPAAGLTSRALGAVAGSAMAAAVLFVLMEGAWQTVDWAFTERMQSSVSTAMQMLSVLRDGEPLSPALVATVYQAVEAQAAVFPAMLGIASMAGMGVAWWVYVRLSSGSDQGIGRLKDFRFNDHLVWVFIGGLTLLVVRWGGAEARIGANAVVFMGLLYALRGAAVVMFVSSGLSVFGYALVAFGLVFFPPVVLGAAMIVGIGDTWLDLRSRYQALAT